VSGTPNVQFETKMLIDGKVVDGEAGTFRNGYAGFEQYLEVKSVAWPVV